MSWLQRALPWGALAGVLLAGGCFPEYSYAPEAADGAVEAGPTPEAGDGETGGEETGDVSADTSEGGPPLVEDMVLIEPAGSFSFTVSDIDDVSPGTIEASFTHPFYIDRYEVTVRRFRQWVDSNRPVPSSGAALDPEGVYGWVWNDSWDTTPHGFDTAECYKPPSAGAGPNTWEAAELDGTDTYPMTCVTWYEAVAFCAWDKKRLPTHAEWVYVASGGNEERIYPWGAEAPQDCSVATFNNPTQLRCGFPVPAGSAAGSATLDTQVYDMAGSVFEWVWDADWRDDAAFPSTATDYAGPPPGTVTRRTRKGGAYIVPEESGDARLENFRYDAFEPGDFYGDAGFRCARSAPGA